uniref:Uncharacterized protein n=1 Tax=Rhipicephalus appendiculatus TaxID=34631 RepID=A0A131YA67_RHIAP
MLDSRKFRSLRTCVCHLRRSSSATYNKASFTICNFSFVQISILKLASSLSFHDRTGSHSSSSTKIRLVLYTAAPLLFHGSEVPRFQQVEMLML